MAFPRSFPAIAALLAAAPRADPGTISVRFTGDGESALNPGIRVCIVATGFDAVPAIREPLFLQVFDFAFPSQTAYLSRGEDPAAVPA